MSYNHYYMPKLSAYRVYLIIRFIQAMLFTCIGAYTALYRINIVHLNPIQLVLVGTVLEITTFLFEVPTGVVADVYSRKMSTIIGIILVGLGFVFEALFPVFITVLVAQIIWGIGFTFISGAREAWIAGEVGETKAHEVYFKGARLVQIGSFLGIILSMILAQYGVRTPIFIGGLLHALFGISLFLFMPEKNFISAKPKDRGNWHHLIVTFKSGITVVKNSRFLFIIILASGMIGAFSEGFDRLWTMHIIKNFTFPKIINLSETNWFGLIFLVTLVMCYIGVWLVGKLVKENNKDSLLYGFIAIYTIMFAAALIFSSTSRFGIAIISTWIIFMLREATGPLYNSAVLKGSREDTRATVFSISSQANALGQIIGGPILGLIATILSIRQGMVWMAIALLPVIALFIISILKSSKPAVFKASHPEGD